MWHVKIFAERLQAVHIPSWFSQPFTWLFALETIPSTSSKSSSSSKTTYTTSTKTSTSPFS
jgi:hypothetical protein